MGYIVALTRMGTPYIDLMVATPNGKILAIQVKTGKNAYHKARNPKDNRWYWQCNGKVNRAKTLLYAFVDLKRDDPKSKTPDVFIVPSIDIKHSDFSDSGKGRWFILMEKTDEKKRWHKNDWHLIKKLLRLPVAEC
jgi:hypothetical protein